jgi:hypothetical protein
MLRQAGIDHEDVEAASLGSKGRENALQVVQVGCVGAEGVDAAVLRLGQLRLLRLTAPGGEDLSTFLAEPVGDGEADAARSSDDQRNLVRQPAYEASLLSGPRRYPSYPTFPRSAAHRPAFRWETRLRFQSRSGGPYNVSDKGTQDITELLDSGEEGQVPLALEPVQPRVRQQRDQQLSRRKRNQPVILAVRD